MNCLYKEVVESKNGLEIPVYNSGRAAHSKYDPRREAEAFGQEASGSFGPLFSLACKSFLAFRRRSQQGFQIPSRLCLGFVQGNLKRLSRPLFCKLFFPLNKSF